MRYTLLASFVLFLISSCNSNRTGSEISVADTANTTEEIQDNKISLYEKYLLSKSGV